MKGFIWLCLLLLLSFQINSQVTSQKILTQLDSTRIALKQNDLAKGKEMLQSIFKDYNRQNLPFDSLLLEAKLIESQILIRTRAYKKLLIFSNKLEENYIQLDFKNLHQQALIYSNKSVALMEMNRLTDALKLGQQAYALAKSREFHEDQVMIVIIGRLANAYSKLKNHKQSISLNMETIQLIDKINGPKRNRAICLNNLAVAFTDLGQLEKAESYIHQAIQIQIAEFGEDYLDLHWDYFNLGNVLQMKGDFKNAIANYKKGNRLLLEHMPGSEFVAENHLRIGECELYSDSKDKAKESLDRANRIYDMLDPHERYGISHLFSILGNYYYEIGEFENSITQYKKSIFEQSEVYGEGHPILAQDIIYLAQSYISSGNKLEALKYMEDALNMARYNEEDFDPLKIEDNYYQHLVLARAGKVQMELFNQSKNRADLDKAVTYLNHAILISDNRKIELQEEASKILLVAEDNKIYELLIEASYQNYIIDKDINSIYRALEYSELARRSTVLESIRSKQIDQFTHVPLSILKRERNLKRQIIYLEDHLEDASYNPEIATHFSDSLRHVLFELKSSFYAFLDSVAVKFPDYYLHRFANKPPDIKALQSSMTKNQAIIEYFDSAENIYAFVLSRNDLRMKKIGKTKKILETIEQFSSHMFDSADSILANPDRSIASYSKIAQEVNTVLLEPMLNDKVISELMIVPDNLESNIPFGILLTSETNGLEIRTWPYAFNKYNIHYAQSILSWQEIKRLPKKRSNNQLVAFAPVYINEGLELDTNHQKKFASLVRDRQLGLPGSLVEVNSILKIYPGKKLLEFESTERAFMEQAPEHKIIHLSAHTFLDKRNSANSKFFLYNTPDSIYDGELTAVEICQMDLHAELAVLSACHTGSGKSVKGEGVMSLGRSFSYAGVPSTLLSLWKVPDQATSKFIPLFYKFLSEGRSKHQALNEARKYYLENTNIDEKCHPYYWGGFVLHGSVEPLTSNTRKLPIVLLSIGAIFLVYLGFRIRSSQKLNNST